MGENVTSRPEVFYSDFSATLWWIHSDHNPRYGFTPNCQNKNEYTSVNSSICLVTGLPAPWPALVSILSKVGRFRRGPVLVFVLSLVDHFLEVRGTSVG